MKFGKALSKNQVPEWSRYYLGYKQLKVLLKRLRANKSSDAIPAARTVNGSGKSGLEIFQEKLDQELAKIEKFISSKASEALNRVSRISRHRQNYLYQTFSPAPFVPIKLNEPTEIEEALGKNTNGSKANSLNVFGGADFIPNTEEYSSHVKIAHLVHLQKSLLSALLAIKYQFFQLIQFKEMNHRGAVKIAKKADKLLECESKTAYLEKKAFEFPKLFSTTFQAQCQQVIDLSDSIQQDLQKTLRFFDPSSEEYAAYGEVLLEKHKVLIDILTCDRVENLTPFLKAMVGSSSEDSIFHKKVVEIIFELACFYRAPRCITVLLESHLWLLEIRDVDERSIFHKIALFGCSDPQPSVPAYPGFKQLLNSSFLNSSYSPLRFDLTTSGTSNYLNENAHLTGEDSEQVFEIIIQTIKRVCPSLKVKVMDIDVFGRRPIHYAAINNFPNLYTAMAKFGEKEGMVQISELWYDLEGCSPLFYAILRGHSEVLAAIIKLFPNCINVTLTTSDQFIQSPLSLAASLGYPALIKLLMQSGANAFDVNETGETALHTAARNGFEDCVRELLDGAGSEAALLANLKEYDYGHTALMLVATEGYNTICSQLLAAGANPSVEDKRGWRAYEYAISNGFIAMGETLKVDDESELTRHPSLPRSPRKLTSLVDKCALVVTLGTNDCRSPLNPVEFLPEADLFTELHNLRLIVSSGHSPEPLAQVDLPARRIQPIVVYAVPGSPVVMNFDIVSSVVFGGELLARGSWRMDTARPTRSSQCVALLRAPSMEAVGHVNVECILATPFPHPHLQTPVSHGVSATSTRVIGHRGMGANTRVAGASSLQVGENTVLSFITAASLGAEYVEFDVQVTRDGVPVIYHDFTVTESDYDIPMHALTHQQFLQIYSKVHKVDTLPKVRPSLERRRSNSVDMRPVDRNQQNRMLLRVKGNNPETIQSPFVTLAETFRDVPRHVGFNIEFKYPMVDEAEAAGFSGSELEINSFVDSILQVVGDHDLNRPLMFSSFNPEICLLLSLKQARIPVFFLSDCGYSTMADYRCNSLRAATRFASAHNLTGLVVLADPLVNAPRLMSLIRDAGLACFTYGKVNNQVHIAQRQKAMGIDAVIVDSVASVSRSFRDVPKLV
ncbi:Glycerophosphocholine phosphodiesterase, variant 2 [Entomophthora muscae]|uniref:Glycerophosphocholine phosphodiesterase, variant 2 n=2 Tax=Entomophthora muscae TaxID=34485 RepID=A0ACC2RDI0_9FUNG|nr:Glycerophosphocholine phosphodiesterase, variant 2 [Entomophthora muscae]